MTEPAAWWPEVRRAVGSLYTGDEGDPLMMRLIYLGRWFTDHVGEFSEDQRRDLLALMERVAVDGSEDEVSAVLTGFVEAMLSAWDRGFDLRSIWHLVGPRQREYAKDWNEFNGIESPDWM